MDNAQNGYSSADNTGKIKKTYFPTVFKTVAAFLTGLRNLEKKTESAFSAQKSKSACRKLQKLPSFGRG